MRTTLKIVLPLIISVVVVSLLFAVYRVRTDKRMLRNEVSRRAEILKGSFWRILLQKSFCTRCQKSQGPLVRFSCRDLRDLVGSR